MDRELLSLGRFVVMARSGLKRLRGLLQGIRAPFDLVDVEDWRQRFVDTFVKFICFAMPLALVFTLPRFIREERWGLIAMDLALWVWAVSGFRTGKRPLTLLVVVFIVTHLFIFRLGPDGARPAWLILVPSLGALLFGAATAGVVVVVDFVMLLAFYLFAPAGGPWAEVHQAPAGDFVMFAVNTSLLAAAVSVPIGYLLSSLERALGRERATRLQREAEHEELETAHRQLLSEMRERERLERSLRQAQKMEAVGRLASGIAHDLNNIILPIMAYTEFAQSALPTDSKAVQDLNEVMAASRRARDLVAQVLTFSRDVSPPDSHVVVQDIVSDIVRQLRPTLPDDIGLELDIDESVGPVHANRAALFQVALNLTSNAVAAMSECGGTLRIQLGAVDSEGPDDSEAVLVKGRTYCCLSVRDTGVGMDEETASHAFEPFFTTRPHGEGTGLGLATAHGIVNALGGKITVETAPGQGSTFRVYLPVSESAEVERGGSGAASSAIPLSGRVLLVDDDPYSRVSIRAQLNHIGLEVDAVASARAAEAALEIGDFDLLVTDQQMPETTGLDLVRRIRARYPDLPVLLVSGYADQKTETDAYSLGVRRVLPKPFEVIELAAAVRATLGGERGSVEGRDRARRAR